MKVITSAARFMDIDAYACCVAYAELLQLLGEDAVAAGTALWNESITPSIAALSAPFDTDYKPTAEDTFVIMDVSNPGELDKIVDVDRVVEVLDHHPGHESFWQERIGEKSRIEFIGAACTLVYERWAAAGKLDQMSKTSAELLAAGILDNTLNFGAGVTTDRDKTAYKFLAEHAGLDDTWVAAYFTECQNEILADLAESLRNDTKFIRFPGLAEELCLGQVVIWDAETVLASNLDTISETLRSLRSCWLANIVNISEGRSYLLSDNKEVQAWLSDLLHIEFKGNLAVADRLWLRKEIMKAGLQA